MKNKTLIFLFALLFLCAFILSSCDLEDEINNIDIKEDQTDTSYFLPSDSESSSFEPLVYTDADQLHFRNRELLIKHYKKHGIDMGFKNESEYEKAAAEVVVNPNALHKTEKEDGDDVYYIESTNEFVIVSSDGYIRTYFYPNAGIDYYNRQ